MCLDVSFHHGIDGLVFRSGVLDPPLRFLHEPVGPLLLSFRVSFLSQSGLQQQCMRGALAHQSIRSTERLGGLSGFRHCQHSGGPPCYADAKHGGMNGEHS
jgi:hypothetical protein